MRLARDTELADHHEGLLGGPDCPVAAADAAAARMTYRPDNFKMARRACLLFAVVIGLTMAGNAFQKPHGQQGLMLADTGSAQLYQSVRDSSDRLSAKDPVQIVKDFPFEGPEVVLDASGALDQEIHGFGGAFTEAAALTWKSLNPDLQRRLLNMYFGPEGIGYTTGRVHINSCDFSPASYSFDDVMDDFNLDHFDTGIKHDTESMIPFIQAAMNTMKGSGQDLRLLATPWSPPAWMKTNGAMDNSNNPCLREEAKKSWALYFTKWIDAYKAQGVPIWAVTVQNEPENNATWEACTFTPQEELDFVESTLGPAMRQAHPEVKMFAFDHNKDDVYKWANATYNHPAQQYLAGIAIHWYTGDYFENVAKIHQDFPAAQLLATEATYEQWRWAKGTTLAAGDWAFGEGYAHDIMGDLNAGSTGWIDWNLLLNTTGGPNHVDNVCDAAVLANATTQELYVHPQYYAMGHFSKFILPGSRRIDVKVLNSQTYSGKNRDYGTCTADDGLQAVGFQRPDGAIAVVTLNCADTATDFKLRLGDSAIKANIPAHAFQTYILPVAAQVSFV